MDLSLIFDLATQGLKKISGSTILSVISISIAVSVFRFNKKMSHSKLSVLPIVYQSHETYDFSLDHTYYLSRLGYFLETRGLPLDRIENAILLDIIGKKLSDFDQDDGIVSVQGLRSNLLAIKLKNKGELPSTNIKIVLVFKAYGSKIKYVKNEKDNLNVKSFKRKVFSKRKIVIKVPYMGADDEKAFAIVDLRDQFRESELILCKIKANGHTYFKEKLLSKLFNRVIINHQIHPYLKNPADSSDISLLLGFDYEDTKWVDPYKRDVRNWIGGMVWRFRSLFVVWRK